MSVDPQRVREFLGDLMVEAQREHQREADAFVIIVVDLESRKITEVRGEWESAEDALLAAAELDAGPLGGLHPAEGGLGWAHIVSPHYKRERG